MRARNNPTLKQLARRLRRSPTTDADQKYLNDPYWALRLQKYPHSYAKRAFRNELPKISEEVSQVIDYDGDPEDILFTPGLKFQKVAVEIRPLLTEDAIISAMPRNTEYTIWDDKASGLGLRVRSSGHRSFTVHYRIKGFKQLRKVTLGKPGALLLEDARALAREILYAARSGRNYFDPKSWPRRD